MKNDYKAMDKEMVIMRENGHTYRHIGDKFGLSHERVRQRINKCKRIEAGENKWEKLRELVQDYNDFLNISFEELDLTIRAHNACRHHGLTTIRKLIEKKDKEFMRIPNFGDKALRSIRNEISALAEKLGFRGVGG